MAKTGSRGQKQQYARMYVDRLRKSCAVTVDTPKTSALVFEKIYSTSEVAAVAPVELLTYRKGNTLSSFPAIAPGGPALEQRQVQMIFRDRAGLPVAGVAAPVRESLLYALNHDAQNVCTEIAKTGHRPVLCYTKFDEDNRTLGAGDYQFAVSCIKNLGIVDEDALSWEQVLEFRRDEQSRAGVSRFLHWLDFAMKGKTQLEIEDILGGLYEANTTALRKFGIYTRSVISESFVALAQEHYGKLAASAALGVADLLWGVLTAGVVLGGAVSVAVRKTHADLQAADDATAFLHSVSRLAPIELSESRGDGPVEFGGDGRWLLR